MVLKQFAFQFERELLGDGVANIELWRCGVFAAVVHHQVSPPPEAETHERREYFDLQNPIVALPFSQLV